MKDLNKTYPINGIYQAIIYNQFCILSYSVTNMCPPRAHKKTSNNTNRHKTTLGSISEFEEI